MRYRDILLLVYLLCILFAVVLSDEWIETTSYPVLVSQYSAVGATYGQTTWKNGKDSRETMTFELTPEASVSSFIMVYYNTDHIALDFKTINLSNNKSIEPVQFSSLSSLPDQPISWYIILLFDSSPFAQLDMTLTMHYLCEQDDGTILSYDYKQIILLTTPIMEHDFRFLPYNPVDRTGIFTITLAPLYTNLNTLDIFTTAPHFKYTLNQSVTSSTIQCMINNIPVIVQTPISSTPNTGSYLDTPTSMLPFFIHFELPQGYIFRSGLIYTISCPDIILNVSHVTEPLIQSYSGTIVVTGTPLSQDDDTYILSSSSSASSASIDHIHSILFSSLLSSPTSSSSSYHNNLQSLYDMIESHITKSSQRLSSSSSSSSTTTTTYMHDYNYDNDNDEITLPSTSPSSSTTSSNNNTSSIIPLHEPIPGYKRWNPASNSYTVAYEDSTYIMTHISPLSSVLFPSSYHNPRIGAIITVSLDALPLYMRKDAYLTLDFHGVAGGTFMLNTTALVNETTQPCFSGSHIFTELLHISLPSLLIPNDSQRIQLTITSELVQPNWTYTHNYIQLLSSLRIGNNMTYRKWVSDASAHPNVARQIDMLTYIEPLQINKVSFQMLLYGVENHISRLRFAFLGHHQFGGQTDISCHARPLIQTWPNHSTSTLSSSDNKSYISTLYDYITSLLSGSRDDNDDDDSDNDDNEPQPPPAPHGGIPGVWTLAGSSRQSPNHHIAASWEYYISHFFTSGDDSTVIPLTPQIRYVNDLIDPLPGPDASPVPLDPDIDPDTDVDPPYKSPSSSRQQQKQQQGDQNNIKDGLTSIDYYNYQLSLVGDLIPTKIPAYLRDGPTSYCQEGKLCSSSQSLSSSSSDNNNMSSDNNNNTIDDPFSNVVGYNITCSNIYIRSKIDLDTASSSYIRIYSVDPQYPIPDPAEYTPISDNATLGYDTFSVDVGNTEPTPTPLPPSKSPIGPVLIILFILLSLSLLVAIVVYLRYRHLKRKQHDKNTTETVHQNVINQQYNFDMLDTPDGYGDYIPLNQ